MSKINVGSRASPLALVQTRKVVAALQRHHPHVQFEIIEIRTRGDIDRETPLSGLGKGVFIKELETALQEGAIDLAVHSLKDLPTDLQPEFTIAAISAREDPRDVLVTPLNCSLRDLPQGARLGTSSPRRVSQLKVFRPDLQLLAIRGNVDTRLRKARGPDLDGVVLAAAGITRLGFQDQITEYLSPDICIPAVGQGALAVETRAGDRRTAGLLSVINDRATQTAVAAERAFLDALGGGCRVPIAAHATLDGAMLTLRGMVAAEDGSRIIKSSLAGDVLKPEETGRAVAKRLLDMGAGELLEGVA